MKPLTIIIFGSLLASRILTEFFSFLSPLGNPSYLLLGMFSIYLSIKSKIGMFLILLSYDMFTLLRNIGFFYSSYISYMKSADMFNINAGINAEITYPIYILSIIFVILSNGIISFIIGYTIGKKHIIGL